MKTAHALAALSITTLIVGSSLLSLSSAEAQRRPLSCRSEESTFVETETKNYWVNICGGDYPGFYVAMEKRRPKNRIRLPLQDYDPQGNYFEAVNGQYLYILAKTPRGMFLTVTQGTRELLREPVLKVW